MTHTVANANPKTAMPKPVSGKKKENQAKLDARVAEIAAMPDEVLISSFQTEAGWQYKAEHDMNVELSQNLRLDMDLMRYEMLARMIRKKTGWMGADQEQHDY